MVVGDCCFDVGCWLLVDGGWWLVVGGLFLVVGVWWLVVGVCWFVVGDWRTGEPTINNQQPTTNN